MKVRQLKPEELSIALDLIEEFERVPVQRPDNARMEETCTQITKSGGAVLGAELNESIVGTCTINWR